VLGENGTAFAAVNGKFVSFNIASGSVNWTWTANYTWSADMIAATAGSGLVVRDGNQVARLDSSGTATYDTWTGTDIQYAYGNMWISRGSNDLVFVPGFLWADAIWAALLGVGNRGSDPNLVLFGQTDCTLTTRVVEYWLQRSWRSFPLDAKGQQIPYTVFEHHTQHVLAPPDGISPLEYVTDPGSKEEMNKFLDEIRPGIGQVIPPSTQTFTYGLKGQQQYRVRRIKRKTGPSTWVDSDPVDENHIKVRPGAEPLIDGHIAPWMGQGCGEGQWPPQ
jgi:hypothetical protein